MYFTVIEPSNIPWLGLGYNLLPFKFKQFEEVRFSIGDV